MNLHIGAAADDNAETVLMPGDPRRAKCAAETFLDDVRVVNETRGMLGLTGTWQCHRVTLQGSGIGMPRNGWAFAPPPPTVCCTSARSG